MKVDVNDETTVTVCDACKKASCWQGKWFCDDYLTAGTVEMTIGELRTLGLEHPSYWSGDAGGES